MYVRSHGSLQRFVLAIRVLPSNTNWHLKNTKKNNKWLWWFPKPKAKCWCKAGNFSSRSEKARKKGCRGEMECFSVGRFGNRSEEENKRDGVVEGIQVEG